MPRAEFEIETRVEVRGFCLAPERSASLSEYPGFAKIRDEGFNIKTRESVGHPTFSANSENHQ
eukprot:693880-Rhodomonas_salina.1